MVLLIQALRKSNSRSLISLVENDPAVGSGAGPGRALNTGPIFIGLKNLDERNVTADQLIARLRRPLARIAGARLFLQAVQDVRTGGRQSNTEYQYTLQIRLD